ncbi:MAG TPA: DUF4258 domain-containing protein [Candidatus Paceibacterota bacterium]
MKIYLTDHAKLRMKERGISMLKIQQVLKNSDYNKPTYEDKRQIGKKFSNQTLEIICVESVTKTLIITLYYL